MGDVSGVEHIYLWFSLLGGLVVVSSHGRMDKSLALDGRQDISAACGVVSKVEGLVTDSDANEDQ